MRTIGTVVRGIRTPIIKQGDNLSQIVVDSLLSALKEENFEFKDKDVVAITEAVVGIAQGNYATVDQIAKDVRNKFPSGELGLVFPSPMSRNRFSLILKGIARGCNKITMLLSYPDDEVGNCLFNEDLLDEYGIDPWTDTLSEEEYTKLFGNEVHVFTGVNYVDFYRDLVKNENCDIKFVFSNKATTILDYNKDILVANIHKREKTKKLLKSCGAKTVYGTDDILTQSVDGSGFNEKYGLLGSNKSTEEKIKLFPRDAQGLVENIQSVLKEKTGKNIEVMVYGDGAFKDPVGKIWELADPVVSPFFTAGLVGTPNELKLKYISDNKLADLTGEELVIAMKEEIKNKSNNLKGQMASQGTTPRQITDLIGSLCDLTSGSGDKGTPVVLVQGYFDNYSND